MSLYICSRVYVSHQYLCTRLTVTCGIMVIEVNPVVATQHIQFVAHSGQYPLAHLNRTKIPYALFPKNVVPVQTFFQNAHIKYCVVRYQNTA